MDETTDPLETVMAAADYFADMDADLQWTLLDDPTYAATLKDREEARERLRLHVQLALAKARVEALQQMDQIAWHPKDGRDAMAYWQAKIVALEARLQED